MQGKCAVAIGQVADFGGFGEVVIHAFDSGHSLVVAVDDKGILF